MARILIIDDDVEFCALLEAICAQAGHEIVVAHNGREGLASYRAATIDLVITDIFMPKQEGLETIRALRQLNPQAQRIAISGGSPIGRLDFLYLAARLGAQRTLYKPFSRQELLAAVRELTQREPT